MKVKVKSNIKWFMSFAPVLGCNKLASEEKVLLNSIMSMKNSFDNVYATQEKIMELTGLSVEEYDSAVDGLVEKGLIGKNGNQWGLYCIEINKFLGTEVYDIEKLQKQNK